MSQNSYDQAYFLNLIIVFRVIAEAELKKNILFFFHLRGKYICSVLEFIMIEKVQKMELIRDLFTDPFLQNKEGCSIYVKSSRMKNS